MDGFSLTEFLGSTGGLAVKGALVAAAIDFVFGVLAAFRDKTFSIDAVGAWIRKHLLGRVLPSAVLVVVAYVTGDALAIGIAAAALTTYAAETMGSVYDSIRTAANPSQGNVVNVDVDVNPIPVD